MFDSLAIKSTSPQSSDREKIDSIIKSAGLDYGEFHIEEFWSAVDHLENKLNFQYVRMDFGVPGLTPPQDGLQTHQQTLLQGQIPQQYPPHSGVPALNSAMAQFVSDRLDTPVTGKDFFVTCGATQALFVAQSVAVKLNPKASSVVFLTPNYPPMCAQARFLGMDVHSIEVDGNRGEALLESIRAVFETGTVAAFCWASPSNPGWTVLNDQELAGIAALCKSHNVIPIEDLTYLGMVTSPTATDKTAPVILPSIAKYADDYFLVMSTSKMLSYAGERIGFLAGSKHLLETRNDTLKDAFGVDSVRRACGSVIFNTTGGAPHSAQYAVATTLEAINRKEYDLDGVLSVYLERAKTLKKLLQQHGFYLIYATENDDELDGFYVSFGYPGLSELALLQELLYLGVTVLPLSIFGSRRSDGVRACVGRLSEDKLAMLATRLKEFQGAPNE